MSDMLTQWLTSSLELEDQHHHKNTKKIIGLIDTVSSFLYISNKYVTGLKTTTSDIQALDIV